MTRLFLALTFTLAVLSASKAERLLPLVENDVVVMTGGTDMVRLQRSGHLETLLTATYKDANPKFRDLAWDADTVHFQGTVDERWREKADSDEFQAFGNWPAQLERVGATVILAQYGAMEALQGPDSLPSFVHDYERLIESFSQVTKRIALISPAPFESSSPLLGPNLAKRNDDILLYTKAIAELASEHGLTFIDLTREPIVNRTSNGWNTTNSQRVAVSTSIANQLGLPKADWNTLEPLRQAVCEKHRLWIDYWRPANWKCLFGDDGLRGFAKANDGLPSFQEEWGVFPSLIAKAEAQVAAVARGDLEAKLWQPLSPQPRTGSNEADIAAEKQSITVTEGYEVNLFADESLNMANPLGMRWDPQGRLYVACTYVYPQIDPGAKPDDTIVVLEDTDGDGRADKSTTFAEGLSIPTAIELGDGGVYVGQGTEVLFLKDTDGDLMADERTVLLSGFGNGDSHQTINTFVWSPSGELFFAQGDGIESRVETPFGVSSLFGPGVFRLSPRRLELHGMLNNFMGPGNPWGTAFDDWGQAILIDGAGGISHLNPAYLPVERKLKLPRIGDPGGYCGIDVLASDKFPEGLRNDFVIGDYKKKQVTRFSTPRDGAGFSVRFEEPVMKSSHPNFRPVDVRVGPEGGIYVADFYNPIICHQDDFYRTPVRDKTHGRIWRMVPKGTPAAKPNLAESSISQLLENLKSNDRWTRYQSKRVLAIRDREEVSAATIIWAHSQSTEFAKLEALRVLETLESPHQPLLESLLTAEDPRIRACAVRAIGRWSIRLTDPLTLLEKAVQDNDARVQMEAAVACGAIPHARAIHVLARLADHEPPMDRWVNYAFTQAVEFLKPHWLPAFKEGKLQFTNPRHLAMVLAASRSKDLIKTERELILNPKFDLEERTRRLHALIAQGEPRDIAFAFRPEFQASTLPVIVSMTREGVIDRNHPEDIEDTVEPLLTHSDPNMVLAAIELIGLWDIGDLRQPVLALAKQKDTSKRHLNAAIEALGHLGGDEVERYLQEIATSAENLESRWRTTVALVEHDPALASQLAAKLLSEEIAFSPNELLRPFLASEERTLTFNRALAEVTIPSTTAMRTIEALVALGSHNLELRSKFNQAAGLTGSNPDYSASFVAQLGKEVERQGDPVKGEDIFRRATMNCYACHQIHGAGGQIGPDLTAIGNAIPMERLIEEVLWPQRQIKEGYNLIRLIRKDGEIVSGYKDKNQDEDALYIRDTVTQKVRRVGKRSIASHEELGSAMPPGLVGTLTPTELRDLLSFLKALGQEADENTQAIRAWKVALAGSWLPFQSRVSGELRAEDLAPFAVDDQVTLRPADGSTIEGTNASELVLKLGGLAKGYVATRERK